MANDDDRDMVEQIYYRLTHAPIGLDCDYGEVLVALGRMAAAILAISASDAEDRKVRVDWFCTALQAGAKNYRVAPTH